MKIDALNIERGRSGSPSSIALETWILAKFKSEAGSLADGAFFCETSLLACVDSW